MHVCVGVRTFVFVGKFVRVGMCVSVNRSLCLCVRALPLTCARGVVGAVAARLDELVELLVALHVHSRLDLIPSKPVKRLKEGRFNNDRK